MEMQCEQVFAQDQVLCMYCTESRNLETHHEGPQSAVQVQWTVFSVVLINNENGRGPNKFQSPSSGNLWRKPFLQSSTLIKTLISGDTCPQIGQWAEVPEGNNKLPNNKFYGTNIVLGREQTHSYKRHPLGAVVVKSSQTSSQGIQWQGRYQTIVNYGTKSVLGNDGSSDKNWHISKPITTGEFGLTVPWRRWWIRFLHDLIYD